MKKNKRNNLHSMKKGQAIIESVLLMVVLLSATMLIFNFIKAEAVSEFVNAPSNYLK